MKNLLMAIFCISISFSVYSQNCIEDYNSQINQVVKTSDGNFVYTSNNFTLTKVNSNFDTIWHNDNLEFTNMMLTRIFETNNGNFVGCGSYNAPYIFMLDPYGDTLWIKECSLLPSGPGGGFLNIRDIIQTADGGFALIGTFGMMNVFSLVAKTDQFGDTLWTNINILYPNNSSMYTNEAKSIDEFSNGDIIVAGVAIESSISTTDKYSYNYRFSSLGDSIWAKKYPNYRFSKIMVDQNDEVVIASSYEDSVNVFSAAALKVNSFGDSIWINKFEGEHFNYVASLSNGSYLFGGSILNGSVSNAYLVQTNHLGDSIWTREHMHDSLNKEVLFIAQKSAGYHVFGSTVSNFPFGPSNIDFRINLDTLGYCSTSNPLSYNSIEDLSFSVYPNPTTHIAEVLVGDYFDDFQIEVFSLAGHFLFNTLNSTVDIASYPNGFYYLKIRNGGKTKTCRLIKNM